MGNCVPVHKSTDEHATELKNPITSEEKIHQIESPVKENKVKIDLSMAELNSKLQSSSLTPLGLSNREEMFFDSQPWMDSDVEDFQSLSGDTTPQDGNSPLHQTSLTKTPECNELINNSSNVNLLSESSPIDMKKQLIDYFQESFSSDNADENQDLQDKKEAKTVSFYVPVKCTNNKHRYESVNDSICSYETAPNGYFKSSKEKPAQPEPQCCFPNLVRSFSDRKGRLNSAYDGCQ